MQERTKTLSVGELYGPGSGDASVVQLESLLLEVLQRSPPKAESFCLSDSQFHLQFLTLGQCSEHAEKSVVPLNLPTLIDVYLFILLAPPLP